MQAADNLQFSSTDRGVYRIHISIKIRILLFNIIDMSEESLKE